jgi:PucR C-terminal helix-turn-helix domain
VDTRVLIGNNLPGHRDASSVTFKPGLWVREVRVDPDERVDPVCSSSFLDAARSEVGQEAVDWAVRLGFDIAIRAIANFPEFGKGAAQIDMLRLGTESAAVIAMLGIYAGDIDTPTITDDAIRAVHDWVHRGVPLSVIWAAMRLGHSQLAEGYMRACVEVVAVADQPDQLRLASEVLFSFVDRFTAAAGREYGIEHERWIMSTVAAREAQVELILAGKCSDTAAAENSLRYQLSHRHHIGLIIWTDSLDASGNSSLHKSVLGLLRAAGAEQTLLVPQGGHSVYAWGNSTAPLRIDSVNDPDLLLPGVRAVAGMSHPGQDGFAKSHREAFAARTVTDTLPGIDAPVVDFSSVHLLTLLGQDRAKAEYFVDTELGGLAEDDPQLAELRKTAAAYLRLKRSPLAVAHELYIVRNTVAYRLKKVEELIGHPLDERTLETWVALILRDNLIAPH